MLNVVVYCILVLTIRHQTVRGRRKGDEGREGRKGKKEERQEGRKENKKEGR
jgi:hypothetical protein